MSKYRKITNYKFPTLHNIQWESNTQHLHPTQNRHVLSLFYHMHLFFLKINGWILIMNSDNRAGNFTFHTKLTVNDNETLKKIIIIKHWNHKGIKEWENQIQNCIIKRKHEFWQLDFILYLNVFSLCPHCKTFCFVFLKKDLKHT